MSFDNIDIKFNLRTFSMGSSAFGRSQSQAQYSSLSLPAIGINTLDKDPRSAELFIEKVFPSAATDYYVLTGTQFSFVETYPGSYHISLNIEELASATSSTWVGKWMTIGIQPKRYQFNVSEVCGSDLQLIVSSGTSGVFTFENDVAGWYMTFIDGPDIGETRSIYSYSPGFLSASLGFPTTATLGSNFVVYNRGAFETQTIQEELTQESTSIDLVDSVDYIAQFNLQWPVVNQVFWIGKDGVDDTSAGAYSRPFLTFDYAMSLMSADYTVLRFKDFGNYTTTGYFIYASVPTPASGSWAIIGNPAQNSKVHGDGQMPTIEYQPTSLYEEFSQGLPGSSPGSKTVINMLKAPWSDTVRVGCIFHGIRGTINYDNYNSHVTAWIRHGAGCTVSNCYFDALVNPVYEDTTLGSHFTYQSMWSPSGHVPICAIGGSEIFITDFSAVPLTAFMTTTSACSAEFGMYETGITASYPITAISTTGISCSGLNMSAQELDYFTYGHLFHIRFDKYYGAIIDYDTCTITGVETSNIFPGRRFGDTEGTISSVTGNVFTVQQAYIDPSLDGHPITIRHNGLNGVVFGVTEGTVGRGNQTIFNSVGYGTRLLLMQGEGHECRRNAVVQLDTGDASAQRGLPYIQITEQARDYLVEENYFAAQYDGPAFSAIPSSQWPVGISAQIAPGGGVGIIRNNMFPTLVSGAAGGWTKYAFDVASGAVELPSIYEENSLSSATSSATGISGAIVDAITGYGDQRWSKVVGVPLEDFDVLIK